MNELKPCPFCGNTNIIEAVQKPIGCAEWFMVKCTNCSAEIGRTSKRKAREAWNRRADDGKKKAAD